MTHSPNVELVRSLYAARERGDYSAADWADPDIEYVWADGPTPGSWRGLAGMAEAMRDFLSAWEGFRGEAEEYHELDDERVLVLVRMVARGKRSGLDVGQLRANAATLYHLRGGKVARIVSYFDGERALKELGLAPQTDDPPGGQGSTTQSVLQWLLPDGRMDREAATESLHEDVVWDMSRSPFPDARIYRGIEGVRTWFEGLADAFGDVVYEVERTREAGEQVALLIHVRGRGPGSGIPVDYRFVPVMTLRAGKIVRMDRYDDWASAMAAMGLSD